MTQHIRAILWLMTFTVLVCCVAYPAVLWGIGQSVFRDKANGSLVLDKSGAPVGSRMIAQPFSADEYFHPRPSAVSYNAAASGASNWAANNPALRKRVAASLGPILKYKDGRLVRPDIAAWVAEQGDSIKWPEPNGDDVAAAQFEAWWKAHTNAEVQPVPADMVMTSGSGLDPDITLDNARYQLDRVTEAWAVKAKQDPKQVRQQIEKLLADESTAPLNGMVGEPMVNVLELNLALHDKFETQ